jgi:endonuclease/exonuclease/phosphatase family metal-dependent hydrolase
VRVTLAQTQAIGLALAILALAVGSAHAGAARPLTFVSFNMFHGGPASGFTGEAGDLDRRLAMTARALRLLEVDVVGLQEASAGRWRGNVAARLAHDLGFHYVHTPTTSRVMPFAFLGRALVAVMGFDEGPAVLSRFPITAHEVVGLPRCRKFFDPRALLRAEVQAPAGTLQIFSTHTSHDACQVRAVADAVQRHRGRLPMIVMGDFNAVEGTPWIASLRSEAGFVDAFRVANPAARGFTVWQRIEARTPTVARRVDYVFVVPGREATGRVVASHVVLDQPERGQDGAMLWPSDHYGVLARVDVLGTATTTTAAARED